MNYKNLIFNFLILLICVYNSSGQPLKTYKGEFNDGIATYTYYEDKEFNRIFQGDFTYIGSVFNVKGQFIKGKENGNWEIWATNKVNEDYGKCKINTDINGNFSNGNFNGLWTYSNSLCLWNYSSKKYNSNNYKEISTACFKENKFIGDLTYSSNWPLVTKIEGHFTETGLLNGTWLIENKYKRHIIKYLNGVAYWRLSQNKETGEKLSFYDSTNFVKAFWLNYDFKKNTSIVNGKKYFAKKIRLLETHSIEGVINSNNFDNSQDPSDNEIENFAIELWTSETISLHERVLPNPLYCYKTELKQLQPKPPYCFEIVIFEKDSDSFNNE